MSDSRDFSLFTGSTAENNRIHCKQTYIHTYTQTHSPFPSLSTMNFPTKRHRDRSGQVGSENKWSKCQRRFNAAPAKFQAISPKTPFSFRNLYVGLVPGPFTSACRIVRYK